MSAAYSVGHLKQSWYKPQRRLLTIKPWVITFSGGRKWTKTQTSSSSVCTSKIVVAMSSIQYYQ
jgi:hypothetical protein